MKIVKYIVLEILLLISMCLCGTFVMKIFDILLKLGYENVWSIGFKVGFTAWLILLVGLIYSKTKKQNHIQK